MLELVPRSRFLRYIMRIVLLGHLGTITRIKRSKYYYILRYANFFSHEKNPIQNPGDQVDRRGYNPPSFLF